MGNGRGWEHFRARWIPPDADAPLERRARIIVSSALMLSGISLTFTLLYGVLGLWPLSWPCLFALAACTAALPVLRLSLIHI